MQYAKLIDGNLAVAPRKLHVDGTVIYNPTEQMLLDAGYLPVVYTAPPEHAHGYIAAPDWAETEEAIVQTWKIEAEPDEVDSDRAMEILFGGGSDE